MHEVRLARSCWWSQGGHWCRPLSTVATHTPHRSLVMTARVSGTGEELLTSTTPGATPLLPCHQVDPGPLAGTLVCDFPSGVACLCKRAAIIPAFQPAHAGQCTCVHAGGCGHTADMHMRLRLPGILAQLAPSCQKPSILWRAGESGLRMLVTATPYMPTRQIQTGDATRQ